MTRRQRLVDMLEYLVAPQNDAEAQIFKDEGLIDDYIVIKNRIPEMSEDQLVEEVNRQLSAYNLEIDSF